jgi:hypothetical protein
MWTKIALTVGIAALFFSVSGALSVSLPTYFAYFYSAAAGLALIAVGLISMMD